MPAGTGSIRAGRAFVEVFADDSRLVRGLNRAAARLKAFGTGVRNMGLKIAGLGALITAPMVAAAKSFADSGARLWDMSKRTGVAVEALSALDYMAAQTGSSLEGVERGVRIMQKSITGAADAAEGTTGSLEHLGLTAADLVGKGPLEQFATIAARLRQIADPTERAAAAMKVFGRSGTELLPMIDQFEKLHGEAKGFGLIRTTESARQAKEFSDTMTLMGRVVKSAWNAVGSAVVPILKEKAEWITRMAAMVRDWIKQNRGLVASVFQIAAVVVIGGTALAGLGVVIGRLGVILGVASTAMKVLGAVLGFLLSPIGMVLVAAAAMGGYLLYVSGAAGKAADWLGQKFTSLKDDAVAAFGGISDALAAGDISLAAKILWATLRLEWTRGVSYLKTAWASLTGWLGEQWNTAWDGIRAFAEIVWDGIVRAWYAVCEAMTKAWHDAVSLIRLGANAVGGAVEKAWNWISEGGPWANQAVLARKNREVDERTTASADAIRSEWDAKVKATEDEYKRKRDAQKGAHDAAMAAIGKESSARSDATRAETAQAMKDAEDAVAAARKEWQESIQAAKEARKAKEDAGPGRLQGPDELLDKFKGLAGNLGAAAAKVGVAGTFNASALLGLQAGGMDDRIAAAAERTAKGVEGLRQDVRNNKAAFT